MAVCEYSQPSMDGQQISCRTGLALKRIIDINGLEGVYTPATLKIEICNNCDPTAREQCPIYQDLLLHGRNSEYCK